MSSYRERYAKAFDRTAPSVNSWFKRLYVVAFNVYAWFWIVREILWHHGTDWESYVPVSYTHLTLPRSDVV